MTIFANWTQADVRFWLDKMSDEIEDWQCIPIPLGEDNPLVLAKGHPLAAFFKEHGYSEPTPRIEVLVDDRPEFRHDGDFAGGLEDGIRHRVEEERVINSWFSRQRNCEVYVLDRGGRRFAFAAPFSPDRSMDRLTYWLTTIGTSDAWDLDAEYRARETLRAMLSDRQWRHYDLTGTFLETSARSRLTYVLRRSRPTIAMSPRHKDGSEDMMRCIAVLCMHPLGYYSRSWGGCMVPSDDVIAHLAMIRADEAYYWRVCNQHAPSAPEAGL